MNKLLSSIKLFYHKLGSFPWFYNISSKFLCSMLTADKRHVFSIDEIAMIDLETYEKIILGASIRYGKHSPKVFDFVKKNKDILDDLAAGKLNDEITNTLEEVVKELTPKYAA